MAWVILLLLLVSVCPSSSLDVQDLQPPRYNLSLDRPPQERWAPVLRHYNYSYLREALRYVYDSSVPKWAHALILPLTDIDLALLVKEPYAGEIRGIAKTLGVSPGDVLALNLAYEATAFCTSIIAQDEKGNVYHGRNLDYNFADILRNLTVELNFISNGQIKYTGTTFLGYIGLWTGQSPYSFTVSGDARERDGKWWENAIYAFLKRSSPVSWLVRDTLENAKDFQTAVLHLSKTPIIAETYYIMAGAHAREGVVITRNRGGPADIWPLDPLSGEWFRVETNYDHWINPPPTDDRRTPAIKALNATGQANINFDSLYKVLSVIPVLNNETVYTTVMSAAYPEKYTTRKRNLKEGHKE
ncbi:N-acylethanolamine-hydrolyzing acid amidase [Spea bombifrons]|uniref:N-acylethanolamine-hydrolyzing acid amidase n=1 Tax=Spea bombifrons TaxID=233779 RepID=UPI00234AC3CC|nr:N-acylethanolamine-hydrolyzing acid amidase [Spea bombifrons]